MGERLSLSLKVPLHMVSKYSSADMPSAAGSLLHSWVGTRLGPSQPSVTGLGSNSLRSLRSPSIWTFPWPESPSCDLVSFSGSPGKVEEIDVSCSTYGCHRGYHQLQSFQSQHPLALKGLFVIFQMFALSSSIELITTLAHWARSYILGKACFLHSTAPAISWF